MPLWLHLLRRKCRIGREGDRTVHLPEQGQFRQGSQADGRRRRVLADFAGADASTTPRKRRRPAYRSPHYGDAAFMDRQPRLTDLIPRRWSTMGLIVVLGCAAVAGVELLYHLMPRLAGLLGTPRIAAFDLASGRNLGTWLTALMLQWAALVSWLIYRIRRHRLDDYRGRYRIWLWACLGWTLLSVDAGSQLHDGFAQLMVILAGTRLASDGAVWWVVIYFFIFVPLGLRLAVDMRECRKSVFLLLMAGGLAASTLAVQFGWITLQVTAVEQTMVEVGAQMTAGLVLGLALMIHARHLVFDAEGRLPPCPVKVLRSRGGKSAAAVSGEAAGESLAGSVPPVLRPANATAAPSPLKNGRVFRQDGRSCTRRPVATSATTSATGSGVVPDPHHKLSKAEKKQLRQRLEQMRQQREQGVK